MSRVYEDVEEDCFLVKGSLVISTKHFNPYSVFSDRVVNGHQLVMVNCLSHSDRSDFFPTKPFRVSEHCLKGD